MALGLFSSSLGAQSTPCILLCLLELCPNLFVPTVGLPGAPMPICAPSLHVTCLNIHFVTRQGPGAPCYLALALVSLFQLV